MIMWFMLWMLGKKSKLKIFMMVNLNVCIRKKVYVSIKEYINNINV